MRIDVDTVVRQRLKRYSWIIPRFLTRWLEKTICQEELNRLLADNAGLTGAEFCRGVLSDLDVSADFHNERLLPPPENTRVVFASNHPLGGLDGLILIDYVSRRYAPAKPLFIVNDLLTAVEPLNDVFLPVNKHGSQSKERIRAIDEAFAGNAPIIVFPAGLCSRKNSKNTICDLDWHKMFVKKSIESGRTVIPTFFCGCNSPFFYNFADIRRRSGLKFNIEMIYLPREVVRSRGKRFNVYFGDEISVENLSDTDAMSKAAQIKKSVYALEPR